MTSRTIVVGAVAYDPKVVTIWEGIKQFFVDHQCDMDFVLFSNYEAQVKALLSNKIDIAWNTNLAYVSCDSQLGGKAKLIAMRDTDLGFTTVIIAKKDAQLTTLGDLRGQTVAFGSKDSAQAAVIPEYFLIEAGLQADKDYTALRFNSDVGKHGDTGTSEREVVHAVLSGEAAAGALGKSAWDHLQTTGSAAELMAIWTSPPYSHCCFTALPQFDSELTAHFVETLMKMDYNNPAHKVILDMEGLTRWVHGEKDGYDTVFKAARKVGYVAPNKVCAAESH